MKYPLNRHFYRYEPPRPLEKIEADIKGLEAEILTLLADVTGSNGAESMMLMLKISCEITKIIQPSERSIKMLDFSSQMYNIEANNTSHAFRKICAPWGVTFFWRLYHAV